MGHKVLGNEKLEQLAAKHKDALEALSSQLVTNFDIPAPRLINVAIAQMGISREVYEQIVHWQNGWEYEPIPQHLLNRWASY